jgi:hypothetical protein
LRLQTWGVAVEPAEFVQAMQDWTKPELDGYTVWVVEWTHKLYLGAEDWPWSDDPEVVPESGGYPVEVVLAPEDSP